MRNDATAEELRIFIGYLREEGAKWANVPGAREYVVALRQMEARAAGLLLIAHSSRVRSRTSQLTWFSNGPDVSRRVLTSWRKPRASAPPKRAAY